MRFNKFNERQATRNRTAFTLVEVLAALTLLAIVVPVAVEALHVASGAGEAATRKAAAIRIAERVLNENIVTTNWNQSVQTGSVIEDGHTYQWTLRNELWPVDSMQLLTAEVTFPIQNRSSAVRLSTLASTTP